MRNLSNEETMIPFIDGAPFSLILLNQPLCQSISLFRALWQNASVQLCADGGANRLYDYCKLNAISHKDYLPRALIGDLDSVKDEVLKFYANHGVLIVKDEDQNSTDFQKSLHWLYTHLPHDRTIVWGALTGRFDHVLSCLYTIYQHPSKNILLLSDENSVNLLSQGMHVIPVDQRTQGPTCGLVPLHGSPIVTTTNLVWNLNHQICVFTKDGLISSSNKIVKDISSNSITITVDTSDSILWIMELRAP